MVGDPNLKSDPLQLRAPPAGDFCSLRGSVPAPENSLRQLLHIIAASWRTIIPGRYWDRMGRKSAPHRSRRGHKSPNLYALRILLITTIL